MADLPGIDDPALTALVFDFNGRNSKAYSHNRDLYLPVVNGVSAFDPDLEYAANPVAGGGGGGSPPGTSLVGLTSNIFNGADLWVDLVHVLARVYAFGNILATITAGIHFHNGYRRQAVTLTAFVNNAGVGLDIPQLSPPDVIAPSSSFLKTGSTVLNPLPIDLIVTTEGVAHFDTTLDFIFDVGPILHVPVSGDRIALFPIEFDGGAHGGTIDELLEWKTDVIVKRRGSSQRIAARKNPRQTIETEVVLDGRSRREVQHLLLAWQGRSFGVPLWQERMLTTAAVLAGASSVPALTDYVDLRVGGLVTILTDSRTYDVVVVDSFTSSTIVLETPLSRAYPAGTFVLPTRVGRLAQSISGRRYPVNAETFQLRFMVEDNDVAATLASAAAFSTFGGKPFLDDKNVIESTDQGTGYEISVDVIDNETGAVFQTSDWILSQRLHSKGFVVNTRQKLYQVRQLLHFLRGRQRTFWIPTFIEDLLVTQTLTATTSVMVVDNAGYTRFVQSRQPKATFRITFTDGTTLTRTILSSVELSATEEQLTIDVAWPSTRLASEVRRVEYLEEVRLDSDEVRIRHYGIGRARVFVPIRVEP